MRCRQMSEKWSAIMMFLQGLTAIRCGVLLGVFRFGIPVMDWTIKMTMEGIASRVPILRCFGSLLKTWSKGSCKLSFEWRYWWIIDLLTKSWEERRIECYSASCIRPSASKYESMRGLACEWKTQARQSKLLRVTDSSNRRLRSNQTFQI